MIYSEAAYFDGQHCAHVAAWEDSQLAARRRKSHARLVRELGERRRGSRSLRHAG